jgi:hypothetical protein
MLSVIFGSWVVVDFRAVSFESLARIELLATDLTDESSAFGRHGSLSGRRGD